MGQQGQVFVFGELHGAEGNYEYMKGALTSLRERGVRNFAMELPEDAQEVFSHATTRASSGVDATGMIQAKNGAWISVDDSYLGLALHAKGLGMSVHCVDAPRDPRGREVQRIQRMDDKINRGKVSGEKYVKEVQQQFSRRNSHMAGKISQLPGDTVLLTGMFHTGGRGSIEEKLRERGMKVVSVDLYPEGRNPTAELFEKHEVPQADLKVKNIRSGPSPDDIGNIISKLRGKSETPHLNEQSRPLRRGHGLPEGVGRDRRHAAVEF
jgi:hypothetical protein